MPFFLHSLIEVYNAVHGSVVGYGKGNPYQALRPGHTSSFMRAAPSQQAVLGMYVQMCESAHQLSPYLSLSSCAMVESLANPVVKAGFAYLGHFRKVG